MNTFLSTVMVLMVCGGDPQGNDLTIYPDQTSQSHDVWKDYPTTSNQPVSFPITQEYCRTWTIDYRFRSVCNSHTSYEFGTIEPPPLGYAPISRLDFPLNSNWHGLQFGYEKPNWGIHLEWLMPMQKEIDGDMQDFDWMIPDEPFTDLGITQQKWIEAQMLDLDLEFRIWDEPFGLPFELWPVGGFRWQKFDIMAYNLTQVKEDDYWPPDPYTYAGDVITFNQQYYYVYLGAQIRTTVDFVVIPRINMMMQCDWGNVNAYNVDHHLLREGDRYTMESTHGDSWHCSFTAEMPIRKHFSVGVEADYLQVDTQGQHHWVNVPLGTDEVWDNGVNVWSDQTWLTAFVRINI